MANNSEASPPGNLNALLQGMVEGMILQDSKGRIIQYNQAALDILGMKENQLNKNQSDKLTLPQEDAELSEKEWDKIFPGKNHIGMNSLKTGEIQRNLIMKIFRYDGEIRWISLNTVPVMDNRIAKASQLICTFTDITDMRRILNDLKQVQMFFNITPDLMIITNLEGYFKKINPHFTNVLGYSLSDVISAKVSSFIHPEDTKATLDEIQKIKEEPKSIHFINRYKAKNNQYYLFDWIAVRDLETNLLYFIARDISHYRAEELDLIHSSKVYSIGEMTSGLAYMINSQLSIIGGHLSFLKSQVNQNTINPFDLKKKIQCIEDSIHRLSKTTNDLTLFARDSVNEEIINVQLDHIFENVLDLCRERFRIHGVKLDIDIENKLMIRCKETQIAHVLITLLNNAYNAVHSQRNSWVHVSALSQNKSVLISISDNREVKRNEHVNISKAIVEENFGNIKYEHINSETKWIIEFPKINEELKSQN